MASFRRMKSEKKEQRSIRKRPYWDCRPNAAEYLNPTTTCSDNRIRFTKSFEVEFRLRQMIKDNPRVYRRSVYRETTKTGGGLIIGEHATVFQVKIFAIYQVAKNGSKMTTNRESVSIRVAMQLYISLWDRRRTQS